jgi:photosystem II stability/assembly factor-like uncharacterized protein
VEDVSLRLDVHRAMDAITPPAPWLGPRIREELGRRRQETLLERARRRPGEFAWLLPAVAVLLAVAIIVTMTLSHRLTLPIPLPVRPHAGAAAGCPTWGIIPGGPNEPSSLKMVSTSVGWAPGDLRTTDGGANWHDVSPKELRAGQPFLPGQQTVYPPNYSDFFLDADHAWLVRSYASDAMCVDHYSVFRTSDGGGTWKRSEINPGNASTPVLHFVDPQHGWLLLSVPNPASHPTPGRPLQTSHTVVYSTTDGGQSWRLVSNNGPTCTFLVFISPTRGFAAGAGQFTSCPSLLVTDDGGATWSTASLPGAVGQLVFFDANHGALIGYDNSAYGIYVTSDGGHTWQQTVSAPSGTTFAPGGFEPYNVGVWFEDQHDFWVFATQPGWNKGGVETDWLYHSSDGGLTWQLVQRNTPVSSPQSVTFVDTSHGFALQTDANAAAQILVTSDGGHTWTPFEVHVS